MVFRVRICRSGYAYVSRFVVFKLPLSLRSLYLGLLYVTLKFCGGNVESFTPTTNFLCVFEHMWSKLRALSIWDLRSKHLRFEVWDEYNHLKFEVWAFEVWGLSVEGLNVWGLNIWHWTFKVWSSSSNFEFWGLMSKCLRFEVWLFNYWELSIWLSWLWERNEKGRGWTLEFKTLNSILQ
jgi:hypothetical protein